MAAVAAWADIIKKLAVHAKALVSVFIPQHAVDIVLYISVIVEATLLRFCVLRIFLAAHQLAALYTLAVAAVALFATRRQCLATTKAALWQAVVVVLDT